MDVSNDAGPPESSLSTYDIPCVLCRRRRVRCSKTLPCQNCDKAGVACSYDDPERTIRRPARHAELSDRLARLEMLVKKSAITQDKQSSSVDVTSTDTLQKTAQSMESLVLQLQQELKKSADGSLSKLTFVEGRSAYIQAGFWAGMYEEVSFNPARRRCTDLAKIASLKYMIEDDSTSESAFYFPFIPAPDYQPISPPKEQSDVFLRVFSENVSPFVRVLHGPRLTFEVNDFRKGKLPDAHIFECQLFVLFALAIITLKPEECIAEFGQEKSVLIKSFKHAAEHGLAHLQIASTHKIRTLQVYLLYIVCQMDAS
jgi:hypothetical protein